MQPLRQGPSCVAQAGLKFLGSSNPPASNSQIAGILSACHCTEPVHNSTPRASPSFLGPHPDFINSSLPSWGWNPGLCAPWTTALPLWGTPKPVQSAVSSRLTHLHWLASASNLAVSLQAEGVSQGQVLLKMHRYSKQIALQKCGSHPMPSTPGMKWFSCLSFPSRLEWKAWTGTAAGMLS